MDVIADAGAVGGVVIVAEDLGGWDFLSGGLGNVWDEVAGSAAGGFAD